MKAHYTFFFEGSEVREVVRYGQQIKVFFSAAHAHEHLDGEHLEGYLRPVTLVLYDAHTTADTPLSDWLGALASGTLHQGALQLRSLRLPTEVHAPLKLTLDFHARGSLNLSASGFSVCVDGNTFHESYAC